jgi:glycosyltransferase involved in cell wall biosynthesis
MILHSSDSEKRVICISNHAHMVGGGEHSFLSLLTSLPALWAVLAAVPSEGLLLERLRQNNVRTQIIPLPSIAPWSIHRIVKSLAHFIELCRGFRPSLIYANGSRAAFYGSTAGRFMGIPVLWHCRIAERDPYLDWLLTRLSSQIVANSRATAKRFNKFGQTKVKVVYNGIDLAWLNDLNIQHSDLIQPGWKIILVVARASKLKRHDIALAAFEQVARVVNNSHLIFIGDKDRNDESWWDELQKKTELSPFSKSIHWIGHIDDLRPWYRAANVLLFPSENEAFGRVLVEAMGSGLPVIAVHSGAVPEIITNIQDGIIVSRGSVGEVADAITKLLNNKSLAFRLSKAGRIRAQQFSLDRHVDKMVQVFDETVESHAKHIRR